MENYSGKAMLDALDTTLGTQSRNADLGDASARATGGESAEAADLLPRNYSLEGLNLKGNVPLEKIVTAVRRFRSGERRPAVDNPRLNILLSGVPGGGKTAFAKYLAHEVGAPLKTLRASDLLSKWIGESEKNLARAFREARREDAILFLDEIDSFLLDRSGADSAWEVSSVNELLQQMENFGGVLVGATNLRSKLDRAVLRRFTFKLELDYLTREGKRVFFDRYFATPLTDGEKARLDAIDHLAPGDFRTVAEELFYTADDGETNAERLDSLEREASGRGAARARIGFGI